MGRSGSCLLGLAGLAIVVFGTADVRPARAEGFRLQAKPTLRLEGGWDSNVFNAAGGDSDWILRASPRLELAVNIKGSVVRMSGGIEGEWYDEHAELNRLSALKNVNLAPDTPIPLSSRLTIAPAAWYVETNDLVRRNATLGGPVTGAQPGPVNISPQVGTTEYAASLKTVYKASPALDLSLEMRGLVQHVKGATATFGDSKSASAIASAGYRFSARDTVGPYLQATDTVTEPDTETNEFSGGITGEHRTSPSFVIRYSGGARLSREKAGPTRPASDSWSPVGSIGLAYQSGTASGGLDLSYEKTAAGNFGLESEQATARLRFDDRLTPRWTINVTSYYKQSRLQSPPAVEELSTIGGTGEIRYLLARWFSVFLAVSELKQWSPNPRFAFEEFDKQSVTLGFEAGQTFNLI